MRNRLLLLVACLLAFGCDRGASPKPHPASAPVASRPAPADPRLRTPGPNGGELYDLGNGLGQLELRLNQAAPMLQAWIWNVDGTAPIAVKQHSLDLQIAAVERERPGRPGNIVVRLVAPADRIDADGRASYFEGSSRRLRGVRAFEAQTGPLTLRGAESRRVLTYPASLSRDD